MPIDSIARGTPAVRSPIRAAAGDDEGGPKTPAPTPEKPEHEQDRPELPDLPDPAEVGEDG